MQVETKIFLQKCEKKVDFSHLYEYYIDKEVSKLTNIKLLEQKMREKNISVSEMSKLLNINESTWYRKKRNAKSFSVGEAEKICNILDLSGDELTEIFFAKKLA